MIDHEVGEWYWVTCYGPMKLLELPNEHGNVKMLYPSDCVGWFGASSLHPFATATLLFYIDQLRSRDMAIPPSLLTLAKTRSTEDVNANEPD